MARYHNKNEIYDVANVFARECLFQNGSYFWPEAAVWTEENLKQFWETFAENLDEGDGSFVEKWATQLKDQPLDIFRLAYEVTALYCLYPHRAQFGPSAKRKLLDRVRSMGPDLGPLDEQRSSAYQAANEADGIGMPGVGYLTNRPFHIICYLAFALMVKRSEASTFQELDPKQSTSDAFEMVYTTVNHRPESTINILLHLFWPDQFEGTASADYKQRMAGNLSVHFHLTETDDVDATILQARRHMEQFEDFPKDFNMYSDDVRPLWDLALKSSPSSTNSVSMKFALAAKLRERVLENQRSFLWPDDEKVWTPENATTAFTEVKHLVGLSHADATAGLKQVLESVDRPIYQVLCDARIAGLLRAPLSRSTAQSEADAVLSVRAPFDGDEQTLNELLDSSNDRFPGSIRGSSGVPMINRFLANLGGLMSIVANPDTIGDRDAMVEQFLVANIFAEDQGVMHYPFWTLLYLMYPDQFPPTPAWSTRQQIRKAFNNLTEGHVFPNELAEVAHIRAKLLPDFDPYTFDFNEEPWRDMWQGKSENATEPGDSPELSEQPNIFTPPTIADLAASTFLNESFLRDIESLLAHKKQLIFEGPPGSGKTYVAEKFARYFTGQPLSSSEPNEHIELVQFHQSYSYEDFVEGIRPRTNDAGQLVYDIEPGIFSKFAEKAIANPDRKFVLIIDEINRGNVSRILGELMLLLEYRDKSARLPYSKELLSIPPNLYIIGTMNSADRSLSQIDYALRRRFYFVRFMAVAENRAPVLEGWLQQQNVDAELRNRILHTFIELNHRLREHLETDDLQVGHSYFMDQRIGDEGYRQHVWKYAVVPLIREYLYHHRERDELLQKYDLSSFTAIVQPIADDLNEPVESVVREDTDGEYE